MSLTDPEVVEPRMLPKRDRATMSEAEHLASAPREVREQLLSGYSPGQLRALSYDWKFWRRPSQVTPAGTDWLTWFIRAGRGFGKTRIGAEQVRTWERAGYKRIALVGPTAGDVRDVMIEGQSGLLSCYPPRSRPHYEPSKRRITFASGAVAIAYSADEPERLRGPAHDAGWCDEPASWKRGDESWNNFSLGLRLGSLPRSVITGTPKPLPWLRAISERPTTHNTVGNTYENVANLAAAFIAEVLDRYEDTTLGRQELHAEWLDTVEGALFVQHIIDTHRWSEGLWERERTDRVVIGVDPPGETAECGIVVVAGPRRAKSNSHAVVLDDQSLAARPEAWASRVVETWRAWEADEVLVESNQGGDMVRAVVHNIDPNCPVRKLRATESKADRAEPVAALYERGRVHHHGVHALLESQLTTWVPDESKSPDRLDALVHAVNSLLPPLGRARGRVRSVTDRQIA